MPPSAIADHAQLLGATVVNTACHATDDAMVEAMLAAGADAYIGSDDGGRAVPFLILLLSELHGDAPVVEVAWRRTTAHPGLGQWRLFRPADPR